MTIRKISIRLGMNYGLYIGICIGFIAAALIILSEYYILSLGIAHVVAVSLSLLIGAILVIGIILKAQQNLMSVSGQICTCRYRSGIHTLCWQCALLPAKDQIPEKPVDQIDD